MYVCKWEVFRNCRFLACVITFPSCPTTPLNKEHWTSYKKSLIVIFKLFVFIYRLLLRFYYVITFLILRLLGIRIVGLNWWWVTNSFVHWWKKKKLYKCCLIGESSTTLFKKIGLLGWLNSASYWDFFWKKKIWWQKRVYY